MELNPLPADDTAILDLLFGDMMLRPSEFRRVGILGYYYDFKDIDHFEMLLLKCEDVLHEIRGRDHYFRPTTDAYFGIKEHGSYSKWKAANPRKEKRWPIVRFWNWLINHKAIAFWSLVLTAIATIPTFTCKDKLSNAPNKSDSIISSPKVKPLEHADTNKKKQIDSVKHSP